LFAHSPVDIFQTIDRKPLLKNGLELSGSHAEGFLDAEQLGELLQQIGSLSRGKIEPRVDGPQFDLPFGTRRINERLEGVLAEDGSQRACQDRLTSIKAPILLGDDAFTQITTVKGVAKVFTIKGAYARPSSLVGGTTPAVTGTVSFYPTR